MTTSTDELSDLLAELRQILEEERRVLLSGNPERISAVAERKLLLADAIEKRCNMPGAVPPKLEILAWLDRYNRGNSVICSAILHHLNQAIDKLRQNESHRSYGPDGAEINPPAPNPLGA